MREIFVHPMSHVSPDVWRRISLILLLLFTLKPAGFAQDVSRGTAIAVVRNDKEIVIATDSRVTNEFHNPAPDICKIRSAGEWYFSLFGMARAPGMDAFPIVEGRLKGEDDIASKLRQISDALTPLLNNAVRDATIRENVVGNNRTALGVVVYGYHQKVLKLFLIKFTLGNDGIASQTTTCPGDCPGSPNGAILTPAIDGRKFDQNLEARIAVRRFVQMEIDKKVADIGGPIQILRIDSSARSEWIEKPQVCRDQK
jgi:hypothetical protein